MKQSFGRIWPAHVSSLTRFLIQCRRSFAGDLDLFLVLAVIGERTYSERHADPTHDFDDFNAGRSSTLPLGINLQSIADYSGIPRETVRRKLQQLVEIGWVSRGEDGSLVATPRAREELAPLTDASIQYIAGMMRLFESELARPPQPGEPG